MDDLARLVAIEEIKQCKSRYWRAIDTKDFELLRTVYAQKAVFDAREAVWDPVKGQHPLVPQRDPSTSVDEAIANAKKSMNPQVQSTHMGHIPEIEITSDTTAKAIFPFEDRVINHGFAGFNAYGYYYDSLEKIDGHWLITHSRISRLRTIFEEPD